MSIELLTLIMFGGLVLFLILGLPLAFCLSGIVVVMTAYAWGIDGLFIIILNMFGGVWSEVYIAIPMFILMGVLLERAGVAEELFDAVYRWSGPLRGGLAMGTVIICAIFAAMTGLTGAATVTMGLIAVPAMIKRRYDKSLALGTVAGAGTLGILIPPSISMVIIAGIAELSVGKLFMGGFMPGLVLAFLFISYIGIRGLFQPESCPAHGERFSLRERLFSLRAIILPALLVLAVSGSIMLGMATPTEASALGAAGTLIVVAIHRKFTWQLIKEATFNSFRITGMVMWIVIGAICFSALYTGSGGIRFINELMMGLEVSRWLILVGLMGIIFILGMFLDPTGIIFIVAPVGFPIIEFLGFDPIWFGILFVIGLQMGYITPPFGFNLFYLKATVPPDITMADIYRSIWPFLGVQALGLALVMIFPQLALWLPSILIR